MGITLSYRTMSMSPIRSTLQVTFRFLDGFAVRRFELAAIEGSLIIDDLPPAPVIVHLISHHISNHLVGIACHHTQCTNRTAMRHKRPLSRCTAQELIAFVSAVCHHARSAASSSCRHEGSGCPSSTSHSLTEALLSPAAAFAALRDTRADAPVHAGPQRARVGHDGRGESFEQGGGGRTGRTGSPPLSAPASAALRSPTGSP